MYSAIKRVPQTVQAIANGLLAQTGFIATVLVAGKEEDTGRLLSYE